MAIKVKAGTTGCNITCSELDEALADATATYKTGVTAADKKGLFEGEQSNPDKEYDDDGDMYLTWYVQISEKNALSQAFNFTLTNQLNSENDYITHFQVKTLDIRMNPLWYISEYYVAQDMNSFSKIQGTSQGYYFLWSTVINSKFSYTKVVNNTGTSYDGWKEFPTSSDASRTIDGEVWHLGTLMELSSILPVKKGASGNYQLSSIPSGSLFEESQCVFGFDDETKNSESTALLAIPKSYWGGSGNNRYAVRFIGTDFCSAWKYELVSGKGLIVTSRMLDKINEDETDKLSAAITAMSGGDSDFWSTSNMNSYVGCTHTLYNSGHSTSEMPASSAGTGIGTHGETWCATEANSSRAYTIEINGSAVTGNNVDDKSYTFTLNLFRD